MLRTAFSIGRGPGSRNWETLPVCACREVRGAEEIMTVLTGDGEAERRGGQVDCRLPGLASGIGGPDRFLSSFVSALPLLRMGAQQSRSRLPWTSSDVRRDSEDAHQCCEAQESDVGGDRSRVAEQATATDSCDGASGEELRSEGAAGGQEQYCSGSEERFARLRLRRIGVIGCYESLGSWVRRFSCMSPSCSSCWIARRGCRAGTA